MIEKCDMFIILSEYWHKSQKFVCIGLIFTLTVSPITPPTSNSSAYSSFFLSSSFTPIVFPAECMLCACLVVISVAFRVQCIEPVTGKCPLQIIIIITVKSINRMWKVEKKEIPSLPWCVYSIFSQEIIDRMSGRCHCERWRQWGLWVVGSDLARG